MGSFVETVNKVASLIPANVEDLNLIVQNIDAINAVAPLANDLNNIIDNIVPNLTEILEADNNATIATEQALLATTNGAAQVALATAQAELAATAKDASESARDIAIAKAVEATTKAGEASISATNALASEIQAGIFAGQLDPSKIVAKDSPTGASFNPVGTTAQRPTTPTNGYIRYNTDLLAFEGYSNGAWTSLGGGATGGGTDHIFNLNGQTINSDYTIPVGMNAVTAGDITIASGITVTISSGSKWSIV